MHRACFLCTASKIFGRKKRKKVDEKNGDGFLKALAVTRITDIVPFVTVGNETVGKRGWKISVELISIGGLAYGILIQT